MKKRIFEHLIYTAFLFPVILIITATQLQAFDLGLHLNGTAGSLTAEPYNDDDSFDSQDLSTSSIGIGIIINSPIGNDIINNRLMFMLEGGTIVDEDDDSEDDMTLLSIYDTIGFVLSASGSAVVWLGPQVGFRSYSVTNEADMDFSGFGVTLGAALGSDFIISDSAKFGLEVGIRYVGGNIESSDYNNYGKDFYGPEGFLGLSVMFKI